MTKLNSIDLTAKLLATENLTVVRVNAQTASFDVATRILYLPVWKDMTPEIESMLVLHEVGHALFTPLKEWMEALEHIDQYKAVIHGYMNVIEDARIEKLMKRRYPGSRKNFNAGYVELLERDFFRLKGKDLPSMKLIDRINLYFKGGVTLGITFTPEEKAFVNRVERCETIDEVISLSKEIFEFSKSEVINRENGLNTNDIEYDIAEELELEDEEFEDEDDNEEYVLTKALIKSEEQPEQPEQPEKLENDDLESNTDEVKIDEDKLESETDKSLNETLAEMADSSVQHRYYELESKGWKDNFVNYKEILTVSSDVEQFIDDEEHRDIFDKFMKDSDRMVNYLVKEFEMRKSAQAYKRAKISKSGSLNMNKVHAYKLTDDIFRRITNVPDGKNHGMVFLLDWSGSMSNVITPTIKQVINLAMFCRRINIPFEVYAFSGSYYKFSSSNEYEKYSAFCSAMRNVKDKNILFSDGNFALMNLFSSKMTNAEFRTIARRFTSNKIAYIRQFTLGDTPLNDALVEMTNFIPEFKRRNNIEKLTLITLTDGQGNRLMSNEPIINVKYDYKTSKPTTYKNFLVDKSTGRNYSITPESYSITDALLRMIKDANDVTTLGFYICENKARSLQGVFGSHFGTYAYPNQIANMRADFREYGFYSLKNTGRDDLFIIPNTSTKIVDEELKIDSNLSAQAISRKLTRNFGNKKNSRILLDKFIGYVS